MVSNRTKISIIIPIFNSERYLEGCLNSILKQSFVDYEVICVVDGASDDSFIICKRYAKLDSRIKVFFKENGGTASARNLGMSKACGDYITFIDADDWIEAEMYEILYENAKKYNADISIIGYTKDTDDIVVKMRNRKVIPEYIKGKNDLIKYAFFRDEYMNFGAYVVNKLFKRELLNNKNRETIQFDERVTRGEDVLFYTQAALRANFAVYSEKTKYHYVQRADSYTHTMSIEKGEGILTVYERVIELCENNDISEEVVQLIKRFYSYHASLLADMAYEVSDREKLEKYKYHILKYYDDYIKTNSQYPDRIARIKTILKK